MNQTVNQADQALARFASLDGENVSMTRGDFLYPEPEEILTCPGYPNSFVGNNVFYPADSKVGDNCLLGTKVMVPVGGPEVTNAWIGNGCTIGRNCYVHYGVVMEDNV